MAFLVDPDNGTGTDYTSINALMVAQTGNLDTEVITLKSTSGSADTTAFTCNEGTASYNFIVDVDHRHANVYDTAKWRHEFTATSGAQANVYGFVKFEFLQFKIITASGSPQIFRAFGSTSNSLLEIYSCLFVHDNTGTATSVEGLFTTDNFNTNVLKVKNCLFYDFSASSGRGVFNSAAQTMYLHNNTAYNCSSGFRTAPSATTYVRNCNTNDCTDGFEGTFDGSPTHNCSDITSDAPGTSSQTGEVTYVDEAASPRDLRINSTDTIAQSNGVDLSGDANLPVSLDGAGNTRHATAPDIGFSEYTSGATIDQEGFRWRKDDGSESTATWKVAQDTNLSSLAKEINVRLRLLLDATGDPATKQFKLQARQKGDADTEWRDIN